MKTTALFITASLIIIACHRKTAPSTSAPRYAAADIEAGQAIYSTGKCSRCHAAKPVETWTEEQWKPILKSMVPKAKLDSVEKMQVTAYVNTHAKRP